jgi:hypothetical protein
MGASTASSNTDSGSYSGGSGTGGANQSAHDERQAKLDKKARELEEKARRDKRYADAAERLREKQEKEARKFELKTTGVDEGRSFVQERLGLEDKQSGTGFYGEKASAATNEYLELAGVEKHSKLWNELKYGISGGAMGSGDPTGVLSSIPISESMLKAQNKIKTVVQGAIGLMVPQPMSTIAKLGMAESSADLLQPGKAHADYTKKFEAKQAGKKFTSTRNVLGVLGLTGHKKKTLGE